MSSWLGCRRKEQDGASSNHRDLPLLARTPSGSPCVVFHEGHDSTPKGHLHRHLTYIKTQDPNQILSELGCTNNVLFLARMSELATMSAVNMILGIFAVMYVGVNITCTILNTNLGTTSEVTFHSLEFVATFLFNVVDLFALSYSPKRLSNQYSNPVILKLMIFINILCSFTACLLVLINLEQFEVTSHELEYCNELTLALFDFIILFSLVRSGQKNAPDDSYSRLTSFLAVLLALVIAGVQLGIYNLKGWTSDGDSKGETLAHYFEFVFGILSAFITFWFTLDNKLNADRQMFELMHAHHVSHE